MNIDKLNLINKTEGVSRVNEIMKMQIDGSNLLPKPIEYKDIDQSMTDFISKNLNASVVGYDIKTFFFAQQRMSEFTKTWELTDENKNVIPNFNIVTRENNPKPGSLQGGMFNIPADIYFNVGVFNKWDGNKNITVTCKMKQPYCVDFLYNIKLVTNRLNILNHVNNAVLGLFKAKQSYLTVNGHYMPITLEDVEDESDYDLNERKIFVQNYQLKVAAYIINENDIIYEENIVRSLIGFEVDRRESFSKTMDNNNNIVIEFLMKSKPYMSFKADNNYHITNVNVDGTNVLSYKISVNDIFVDNDFYIEKYDRIKISIEREDRREKSKITLITE